jgi:Ala-tRNA(Pro) deacylase
VYKIDEIFTFTQDLFLQSDVKFEHCRHQAITNYDIDEQVCQQFAWTAQPTKSLFLKLKGSDKNFALLFTLKDQRLDSKAVKTLLGKRVSVSSNEEMIEQLGCVPGAVCPFMINQTVPIIIDPILLTHSELLFTPGDPESTFIFSSQDLDTLLAKLPNPIHYLPKVDSQ